MIAQIPPLLEAYPKLVIEANFKAHELHAVLELAEKMHLYIILLYMNGSYVQAYERYKLRDRDRHIAHKSHGDISYETFVHIQQSFIVNESKPLDINVDQFDEKHLKDLTTLVERLLALE